MPARLPRHSCSMTHPKRGGTADQYNHRDDPARAARLFAADLAIEFAVEESDAASSEDNRMRNTGE